MLRFPYTIWRRVHGHDLRKEGPQGHCARCENPFEGIQVRGLPRGIPEANRPGRIEGVRLLTGAFGGREFELKKRSPSRGGTWMHGTVYALRLRRKCYRKLSPSRRGKQ